MTHYDVLGAAPDATPEELRAAYWRRARVLHPDTSSGDQIAMQELNAAWEELKDPARRRAYDASLARQQDAETWDQVPPADEWGVEVDDSPLESVDEWGEEIHDGSPEVVNDWDDVSQPPHPYPPDSSYPPTYRPFPLPGVQRTQLRLPWPTGWRLVLLWILILYSLSPIVSLLLQAASERVTPTMGTSMVIYIVGWVLAYRVSRYRVITGRLNMGYVVFGLVVAASAASSLALGQLTPFVMVGTWLALYIVAIELWNQQVWRM